MNQMVHHLLFGAQLQSESSSALHLHLSVSINKSKLRSRTKPVMYRFDSYAIMCIFMYILQIHAHTYMPACMHASCQFPSPEILKRGVVYHVFLSSGLAQLSFDRLHVRSFLDHDRPYIAREPVTSVRLAWYSLYEELCIVEKVFHSYEQSKKLCGWKLSSVVFFLRISGFQILCFYFSVLDLMYFCFYIDTSIYIYVTVYISYIT